MIIFDSSIARQHGLAQTEGETPRATMVADLELARLRAAGVRHAVLLRVMPVFRHDLANQISIVRMTSRVLRRRLETAPVDTGYCLARVAVLDQQADALTDGLGLLKDWETSADEGVVTRPLLVARCVTLLAPALQMQRVTLEVEPALRLAADDSIPADEPPWPRASALRYLLLASICYLQDAVPEIERIRVEREGNDALRLRQSTRARGGAAEPRTRPVDSGGEALQFDATSIDCLAQDLGRHVEIDEAGVVLRLAAA